MRKFNGAGSVSKRDVQTVTGWNDAQLQANAATINFTVDQVKVNDNWFACTDGSSQHVVTTTTGMRTLVAAPVKNPQGKVISWTLNGYNGPAVINGSSTTVGSYSCPAGSSVDFGNPAPGAAATPPPTPAVCTSTASSCR